MFVFKETKRFRSSAIRCNCIKTKINLAPKILRSNSTFPLLFQVAHVMFSIICVPFPPLHSIHSFFPFFPLFHPLSIISFHLFMCCCCLSKSEGPSSFRLPVSLLHSSKDSRNCSPQMKLRSRCSRLKQNDCRLFCIQEQKRVFLEENWFPELSFIENSSFFEYPTSLHATSALLYWSLKSSSVHYVKELILRTKLRISRNFAWIFQLFSQVFFSLENFTFRTEIFWIFETFVSEYVLSE